MTGRPSGKKLLRLLGAVAALPVSVLVGGVLGGLVAYAPQQEDVNAPSSLVTVMARWDTQGESLCRAFMYRDLLPRLDSLDVLFALTPEDLDECRADFAAYDNRDGWPRVLVEGELNYPGYSFDVEGTAPLRLMVHRSSGDATWAKTRYAVQPDGSISDLETETASAGQGIGLALGGLVGALVWVLWLLTRLFGVLRPGRRARA